MGKPITILVVDPDQEVGLEYQELSARRGWLLYHVPSFTEALELVPRHTYDVAIIEVVLPDIIAADAWRYIRKLSPDILGIITTTSRSIHETINVDEPGIISFLLKPCDRELMGDLIEQALESQEAARRVRHIRRQLSGLSTLLGSVVRVPADKVTDTVLSQIPAILNPGAVSLDGIAAHFLNPDKTWTTYSMGSQAASQDEALVNARLLQNLTAEAIETSKPALFGIPLESEHAVAREDRIQVDLGRALAVPVVGFDRTHGVLAVTSGAHSGRPLTSIDVDLVKIIGQSVALLLDRARYGAIHSEGPILSVPVEIHES